MTMSEQQAAPALRTMFDSANMDAIPIGAQIVAGYPHRGGDTIWNPARFPHALIVAIDQHGNHPDDCHAADYEAMAIFGPAAIRLWAVSWHQLHPNGLAAVNGFFTRPLVYSDEANLATVRRALAGLVWDLWVAAWPGAGPVLQDGAEAHQYASDTTGSGGDFDLSVVSARFGAHPAPPPHPTVGARIRDELAVAEQAISEAVLLARLLP